MGAEYWGVIERFFASLKQWQPHTLVQFEDFANHHAFQLLERYRGTHCCFNDDIQGTACITLAGGICSPHVHHASYQRCASCMRCSPRALGERARAQFWALQSMQAKRRLV